MIPAGTSNELVAQNEWEENTHTHTHITSTFSVTISITITNTNYYNINNTACNCVVLIQYGSYYLIVVVKEQLLVLSWMSLDARKSLKNDNAHFFRPAY